MLTEMHRRLRGGRAAGRRGALLLAALGFVGAAFLARDASVRAEAAEPSTATNAEDTTALRARARAVFGTLPAEAVNPANPSSPAKIKLGRMLYYDARLSKNQDVSCNTCHLLDHFGVDGLPTSKGHRGQFGPRNAPTVYNAALQFAQFWDGRAADVEEQAKGPVLNPVEMAMASQAEVLEVLRSIPGYAPLFKAAFPAEATPITFDNMAKAIGAFERQLMTPSPFDDFLAGDDSALDPAQREGLSRFMSAGCITCHQGVDVGGSMFQKLGLVKPYPTKDLGREAITGNESDRHVFKVPSLRNVTHTAPYFHDGSIARLEDVIHTMGEYQLGLTLNDAEIASIKSFLGSLAGRIDAQVIAPPALPASGPDTPPPNPL
jgi:cytochrome c peroxidase